MSYKTSGRTHFSPPPFYLAILPVIIISIIIISNVCQILRSGGIIEYFICSISFSSHNYLVCYIFCLSPLYRWKFEVRGFKWLAYSHPTWKWLSQDPTTGSWLNTLNFPIYTDSQLGRRHQGRSPSSWLGSQWVYMGRNSSLVKRLDYASSP